VFTDNTISCIVVPKYKTELVTFLLHLTSQEHELSDAVIHIWVPFLLLRDTP